MFLDAFEAMGFVKVPCGQEAVECPEMGFGKAFFIDEGQCGFQQPASDTATAHAVINDEPAQMRNIRSRSSPSIATEPMISCPRIATQIAFFGLSSRLQKAARPSATTDSKLWPKPDVRA